MRMRIRTRLVAAVLTAGTLTAVVAASTSPALAEPTAANGVTAEHEPAKQKPVQDEVGEEKAKHVKPGEPGKGQEGVPAAAVELLAVKLGITVDRSREVYRDLEKVKSRGAEIVGDRAFIAIADGLGVTPERLLAVLREVKQEIAVPPKPKPGEPVGSPSK
ncbi:hypothetical protein ACQPYE_12540 [Actinosynnema sp. CA-299493]